MQLFILHLHFLFILTILRISFYYEIKLFFSTVVSYKKKKKTVT